MFLFITLVITLLILLVFIAVIAGTAGAAGILIFGDVIVCAVFMILLIKKLFFRKHKN